MSVRKFELAGNGSQTINILQEGSGTPITVSLNDRLLGMLTSPEDQGAGRDFTLDDGAILTVKVVDQQAQVRHNGLPLFPARATTAEFVRAARYDKVTKWIMLMCARIALSMGLLALGMIAVTFFFQLSTFFTGIHSVGISWPGLSSDLLAAILFLIWATCFGGYVLLVLLACIAGFLHALATHRWKWGAFALGPLMLIGMVCLVLLLRLVFFGSYTAEDIHLDLVPSLVPFPISMVCLFYAQRLE